MRTQPDASTVTQNTDPYTGSAKAQQGGQLDAFSWALVCMTQIISALYDTFADRLAQQGTHRFSCSLLLACDLCMVGCTCSMLRRQNLCDPDKQQAVSTVRASVHSS